MRRELSFVAAALLLAGLAVGLGGCGSADMSAANKPIPLETLALMEKQGLKASAPIFIRIFKRESELEIWKQREDGRFALLKTYPVCKWSGDLGPKLAQGDKQAPEGFYTVGWSQMNPRSAFHLSFNLGFPNALDRAYDRTGQHLMVHGDCRSAGCYAMTDALIEEIYAIAREAFAGGQEKFQVQALPFRMTEENMKRYGQVKRWQAFWRDLKKGHDAFEATRIPPKIDVCERRYLVNVAFENPKQKVGAADYCPPHRAFVPDIEETPQGPRIVQAEASSYRPEPALVVPTAARGDERMAATGVLAEPQQRALQNTLRIGH